MKKALILAWIAIFVMSLGVTAFAASPSFNDVPKDHWAYNAVNNLVKAGLIEGYNDGTYRGDKTITRYEFAVAITKALQNYDKANDANKATIDKLSQEFAAELNTLGTRVTKVENKIGTFKLNGDARFRYEYVKNPTQSLAWPNPGTSTRERVLMRERYRLMLSNEVADNLSFFALMTYSGSGSGSLRAKSPYTTDGGNGAGNPGSITSNLEAFFGTYKAPDGTVYKFGRNTLFLGQGMLWDVPHAEGLQVTFGNQVRTMVGYQAFIGTEWYFADMKYALSRQLQLTAAHIHDKDRSWYNSTAVGFVYKPDSS